MKTGISFIDGKWVVLWDRGRYESLGFEIPSIKSFETRKEASKFLAHYNWVIRGARIRSS